MCKTRIEQKPNETSNPQESLFTNTAICFATLFFPSINTHRQRDELRKQMDELKKQTDELKKQMDELKSLRDEHAESHKHTLELQRQMHEFLYRK